MVKQITLDIEGMSETALTDRQTDRQTALSLEQKVEQSKRTLRLAADMSQEYYKQPLIITYSGGKDSDVLLHLAEECLEPGQFEVLNSHTSVDAPETVYHIREVFKRLNEKGVKATVHYPKDENGKHETMWTLIPKKKMPPTRLARYCCQVLKETSTPNRIACLGVREAESAGRKGRDVFGIRGGCYRQAIFFSLDHTEEVHREAKELNDPVWDCTLIKRMREHGDCVVNPIYDWSDLDIWDYIRQEHIDTNPLYKRGYTRVGCVGCPMATYKQVIKEFNDYPTFKNAYINAFERMLEVRRSVGKVDNDRWKDGQAVFDWWIEKYKHSVKGQLSLFEDE